MAVLFDTLKLAQRLEAAGMPPEQAKGTAAALAETMAGDVATRQDLQVAVTELRGEIGTLREYVDRRFAETKATVRGWLMTQAFAIVGAVAAIVGIAAALARLIP